jgi:hypothetical protein
LLTKATIPVAAVTDIDLLNSTADLGALLDSLAPTSDHKPLLSLRDAVAAAVEGKPDHEIIQDLRTQLAELEVALSENRHTLSGARSALRRLDASASKWHHVKQNGVAALPDAEREKALELIAHAKTHGLWIVPVGELESWLDLGTRHKRRWVVQALQALHAGSCPPPLSAFVREILAYLGDVLPETALGGTAEPSSAA